MLDTRYASEETPLSQVNVCTLKSNPVTCPVGSRLRIAGLLSRQLFK